MANKRLCSVEDCSNPHNSHGYCGMHAARYLRYGDLNGKAKPKKADTIQWIETVAMKYDGSNCLTWPFSRKGNGYGELRHKRKSYIASRLICEMMRGKPPSPTHEAAHSCGNGSLGCVNPNHLFWKTPSENNLDKILHGTINRGEKNANTKLSKDDVIAIRQKSKSMKNSEISSSYNISQASVSLIISRKRWVYLD